MFRYSPFVVLGRCIASAKRIPSIYICSMSATTLSLPPYCSSQLDAPSNVLKLFTLTSMAIGHSGVIADASMLKAIFSPL